MKNVIYASVISEARLRKIIQEELQRKYLIEEGLWDDVKDGIKKLSNYVSEKFKAAASEWASTISSKIEALSQKPEELNLVMAAIKQGMAESGDSLPLDETLKMAKELTKDSALAAIQSDLEGPVKEKAEKLQTGAAIGEAYSILVTDEYIKQQKILKEMGPETVLGFGLAIVGGLPLLFKGLLKLANYLNAPKAAELFEKAEHVTHAIEEKVIDYIVPDTLSYQIYKFLNSKGYHVTKNKKLLTYEQYKSDSDKSNARKKTDGLVYKAMLIYFAINGLVGVLKAGASLLGFVEGGATAVKGVELARGAEEVANIVRAAEVGAVTAAATRAASSV